jgi:hypothetical protein
MGFYEGRSSTTCVHSRQHQHGDGQHQHGDDDDDDDDDDMSSTNQATRHVQIMSYDLHPTNQSKHKAPHQ